jgi:hypothetical protein
MTPTADKDWISIGCLAAHLQRSVRAIEGACEKLRIAPALRLNHIAHFDAEQVEQIREHLERSK